MNSTSTHISFLFSSLLLAMSFLFDSSSSSGGVAVDLDRTAEEDNKIAAIVICTLIGAVFVLFVLYKLTQRFCPSFVNAFQSESSSDSTVPSAYHEQQSTTKNEEWEPEKRDQKMHKGKSGGTVDIELEGNSLSNNEQWTVRVEEVNEAPQH